MIHASYNEQIPLGSEFADGVITAVRDPNIGTIERYAPRSAADIESAEVCTVAGS
jgi:hypothetical protein